jgi:hypothetical protein
MKSLVRLFAAAAWLAAIPSTLNACSACIVADPKTAGTYLSMTLMLSTLPIGLIGGLIYWIRRRYSEDRDRISRNSANSVDQG